MIDKNEKYVIIGFACADDIRGIKEELREPKLIEVAAVKVENRKIVSHFSSFIALEGYDAHDVCIDYGNAESYGVKEDHLVGAPEFKEVAKRVCEFSKGYVPVAMPSFFDTIKIFLGAAQKRGLSFDRPVRYYPEVFPIKKNFGKEVTAIEQIFTEYDIFLLNDDTLQVTRHDILTYTLAYARLALALMNEEDNCIEDLYDTLFSEYGITFLEGLKDEREDELALAFCNLADEELDGVTIFTDKEQSFFSDFPLERLDMPGFGGAVEKIAPLLKGYRLAVLDLKIFSNRETFSDYKHMAEVLSLLELAKSSNINFLIPIHFEKPFSAWRNSKTLGDRHVQVVQLFNDRGSFGINIFGGKNFPCNEFVLIDIETSGLNETHDRVIWVSAKKIIDGVEMDSFCSFVAFDGTLPPEVVKLTHISDELLKGAPDIDTVMEKFSAFCGDLPIYADNAPFVQKFLKKYSLNIHERNGR